MLEKTDTLKGSKWCLVALESVAWWWAKLFRIRIRRSLVECKTTHEWAQLLYIISMCLVVRYYIVHCA